MVWLVIYGIGCFAIIFTGCIMLGYGDKTFLDDEGTPSPLIGLAVFWPINFWPINFYQVPEHLIFPRVTESLEKIWKLFHFLNIIQRLKKQSVFLSRNKATLTER